MIGYSIVSDNAYAPEQSNSIYISKTNQKSSISYITTLRLYRKKFFRNKPLDQYGASILSEDLSLLQFTLRQHILRYGVCQFKNHVIPYPSTLNYKLSVRTATNNQLNICNILTRTSAKFWHQHMVSQTYLAIGKHIKVYDWPLTKTDVGKRTDQGRRRILKPLYQSTNCSEKICLIIIPTSSRICLKQRKHSEVQQARNTGFWKRRYTKENSSSSLHTQWAIDQGATRLGGL